MPSYRWQIASDYLGTGAWEFVVNPFDVSGMNVERAYTEKMTVSGVPIVQFAENDYRVRSITLPEISDDDLDEVEFLLGDSELDTDSLLYLSKLDDNGQLTTYWLNIPQKRLRPYGYREVEWIPISVVSLALKTETTKGTPWWTGTLKFRVSPWNSVAYPVTLGFSELGSPHTI